MIRSFQLADLFTIANAFCGMLAIFEAMTFLSTRAAWHLYLAAALIPVALAFDGANMWVANQGSNTVTRLRASDAVVLAMLPVGPTPIAAAFDGTNVWLLNAGNQTLSRR